MRSEFYSWYGTKLVVLLPVKKARQYNRFMRAFYKAQDRFKIANGRVWDPISDPISIDCKPEEVDAYNYVGAIVNEILKEDGEELNIREEDFTSDYLVRVREF